MRKLRITALIIAVCMICGILPLSAFAADDNEPLIVHVSAEARFTGDGSEAAPFKTIEAAQTFLRSKDHRKRRAEVVVHAGTYAQPLSLNFTQEDSGTETNPVIYRAAGDGEVRITNAVKLDHMAFQPIRDKAILTRLTSEVRDKVGVLDLQGYGLNKDMFDVATRTTDPREHKMYPYLYLNGKKQTVSRWPNVGLETIQTVVETGEAISGGGPKGTRARWKYNTMRPERWLLADQAIIRGYLGTEYAMDSVAFGRVDTDEKTVSLAKGSIYGVKPGHRWYIENLLEEVDSPGEFFVDAKTMKLYFYPPYNLSENDVLELSTHSKTYITVNGASNIIFDGINVSDNVEGYGYYILNSNNITVRNATIKNIATNGIFVSNSKKCLIEACTLYDIGANGIKMHGGGDVESISPGGNRISNCHIYRWAINTWMQANGGIDIGRGSLNKTIGDTAENCIIHGQPNGLGILYGGVENIIQYNEIYSVTNESADLGAIYAGRSLREFGNVIRYNYIHDFAPIFEARYQVQGIYWDDWESGQTAHHNIIVPGSKNRTAGNLFVGADSYYCENIVVNSDIGVRATDRGTAIMSSAYDSANEYVSAALIDKYPAIGGYRAQLEKDNMILLMKGNVFENNLSVDVNSNNIQQVVADNGSVKNNQITDDYSVFVDAENQDYRLKMEAVEKFGFPETFLNEENFDMAQIGIQPEVMKIEKIETPFRLLYPKNGQMDVIRNTAYIKWEEARFADIYEYVVATDPELKNVVASGKSLYNVVELPDLKNDTVYYYKVYAKNLSKQIGNTWGSEGVPYMFKTTAEDVLEKEFLKDEIENIKALKQTITTGKEIGQYKPEALVELDNILKTAQNIVSKATGQQAEIQETVSKLQAFASGISGYRHAGHSALNIKDGDWVTSDASIGVTKTDDIVKIQSFGNGWAYLNETNPGYLVKHFKMKINFNGWTGISLKQSDPKVISYNAAIKNYLIVLKTNQIEFQKYNPGAAKTGVITTYPNDYIKDGEWVDIEFGCVDVPGGVNVFLKANGKEIFNEFDSETPNFGDGYFVVRPGSDGAVVELQQADPTTIPSEEYIFEGASEMDQAKTMYNLDAKIAVKEGTWTDGTGTTADGSKVKISTDKNAKVTYTITDQEVAYETYYYHTPQANGDKNATIKMVAYSPTTGGKTEVTRKVDFSQGEEGWVYLGTYECASYSRVGDIIITVEGSGEGTLVAPVIGSVKASKELLEFNRTFYDYSNNLLLMKIDSQKAFSVVDELQIPDAAPYIENNITMVPLRFVAEAFDATVDWNAAAQKATITSGDKVVEFTLGSKAYTANGNVKETETEAKLVNGRTMIPLRATAEALGKKVMWYGDAKLIFIADRFNFAESDTTKLQNAANGFERGFN